MSASSLTPGLSVVVPAYRSAPTLPQLVANLEPVLKHLGGPTELVLVDDGSPDNTWDTIVSLSRQHPWVRGVRLMRNFGQHNALLAGIRTARFDRIATMDDDLQNPPDELPKLLSRLAEGFDVVYGSPARQQHGLFRDLASVVTKYSLQSAVGAEAAGMASAFRVFRTPLRDAFAAYNSPFVSIDVLLTWGATRFSAVLVRHDARVVGQSNYTFRRLVRHALNMMTGFSVIPLQLASVVGFGFTLFGAGVLVYVVANYFWHGTQVAGFPFLASIIALFAGAQLFALGIIGEYLARMHFRTMDKPAYVVHARIGPEA